MVELENKYQIGVRRFGIINWVGAFTLYKKEVLRFIIVSGQTLVGPILTSILFLVVISLAIGDERPDVLGVPYIEFLANGLIMMQVIQQSFSHSSSSLMMSKVMGTIVDIVNSPLSAAEVTISVCLAAVTRSFIIAFVSIVVFYLIIDIQIKHFFTLILFTFLSSFILGNIGTIAGLWAEKFDHMASVTNFVIVPLSFLSCTFYTIDRLPSFLKTISEANPFFYMIDVFRYCFIGNADGSIKIGIIYLTILSFLSWLATYILFKKGYKIKS